MRLFSGWRRLTRSRGGAGSSTPAPGAARAHLEQFARSRTGVEAFVEPATTVTPTTLLLVAADGEWTRRPAPDPRSAAEFARRLGVPVYDINLTGYPQRMRDYNARRKADGAAPD
jgi:hypothetical protein